MINNVFSGVQNMIGVYHELWFLVDLICTTPD